MNDFQKVLEWTEIFAQACKANRVLTLKSMLTINSIPDYVKNKCKTDGIEFCIEKDNVKMFALLFDPMHGYFPQHFLIEAISNGSWNIAAHIIAKYNATFGAHISTHLAQCIHLNRFMGWRIMAIPNITCFLDIDVFHEQIKSSQMPNDLTNLYFMRSLNVRGKRPMERRQLMRVTYMMKSMALPLLIGLQSLKIGHYLSVELVTYIYEPFSNCLSHFHIANVVTHYLKRKS